eukprot:gnl/MRDRNA2_/MRDRNA2_53143_c0_seq1.p1 gnl/MRDRNA2_/MRDRNA2_53143_c0~~gnl/MRDRNA2_/MRDRNA2_53143_c0_seq1.p1  ORF type:complete len:192 (-),score=25.57 gnl/MRDRNA2_/MRDRNA2_53143_c0_seq1:62-637(-)
MRGTCCRRPMTDMARAQEPPFKLCESSDFVTEHNQNNEQRHRTDAPKALCATRALQAGDVLHSFHADNITTVPSHWTLQVGPSEHIDLSEHVLRYINHACEPNVVMQGAVFKAHRDIVTGEELAIDYNTSEFELMGGTFRCSCCSTECVGEIRGWKHLKYQEQAKRIHRCQPWLRVDFETRLDAWVARFKR